MGIRDPRKKETTETPYVTVTRSWHSKQKIIAESFSRNVSLQVRAWSFCLQFDFCILATENYKIHTIEGLLNF